MKTMAIIAGWASVVALVILFSDVVGVIKSRIYKERTLKAEFVQRNIWLKLAFLGLSVLAFLMFRVRA